MIEITDLFKYYGKWRAVGPLSFTIEPGEVVGLLGLNGAGKTTTLRILACDLLPSSGAVKVGGLDVVEHPHEVRARIGYLPDVPPLYPEMTVEAYLNFTARLRGVTKSDASKRATEASELTQLVDVFKEPIQSLSHGYKQRVGIAQAIVHKPSLLVLDEPISGLDPVQIVEMRALLRNLKGSHTILLSSHILSEISETCDRILVMRDGRIEASGTEKELSAQFLQSTRAAVTLRYPAGDIARENSEIAEQRMRLVLEGITGVQSIVRMPSAEAGDARQGIAAFEVDADRDVREAICHAVVQEGGGILEVRQSERELESVFLRLAGASSKDLKHGRPQDADGGNGDRSADQQAASKGVQS